jgi:hypothetical protein
MRILHARHRSFVVIFAAAVLLHLLMLLVPVIRQTAEAPGPQPGISVRLVAQPAAEAPAPLPEPPPEPERIQPAEPIELADLPAPDPAPVAATPPEKPPVTAYRILNELREKQEKDPLASFVYADPQDRPDFAALDRPVLEEVLNQPSLQLPFRDTRIYLVDSYDPGFLGGVQKFFDDVTVPFGFTTKNNTRVQCAWILVLAGCAWGDASSYYNAQTRARKRKPESM